MRCMDFSPPPSPTLDQQRDALRKGLGRAMQWAMAGRLADAPLLEACLRDLRYDAQLEEPRGEWLWRMIQAVDAADRFRGPILRALHDSFDDHGAQQLCELAFHFADTGDGDFRSRLFEIVERPPIADDSWLGQAELVELDGEPGFLFAARARGGTLADREWQSDDDFLVEIAIERFGEQRVNELLVDADDGAIQAYREGWRRSKQVKAERKKGPSIREKVQEINAGDILSAAESNDDRVGFFLLGRWGMFADESDLETIFESLWTARKPTALAKLLQVFSKRGVPRFDARLLELCRHGDDETRRLAILAMEKVEHPAIREYALAELESGMRGGSVVALFTKNYQRGDEQRILQSITFPDEDWKLHSLLMDVIQVLEANPAADCSQLGIAAYASTPCETCRFHAVRLLRQRLAAPDWLIKECRFDSNPRSRELAAEAADSPRAEFD